MSLDAILQRHSDEIDAQTEVLDTEIQKLLRRAEAFVLVSMLSQLNQDRGRFLNTVHNRVLLAQLASRLQAQLDIYGLSPLIDSFVSRLHLQVDRFLEVTSETAGEVLAHEAYRGIAAEGANLAAFQQAIGTQLRDRVTAGLQQAQYRAVSGAIGAKSADVFHFVADTLDRVPVVIKADAATAMSVFYRTVADLGFLAIEAGGTVRYTYVGPPSGDPVIRPFCKHLMKQVEQENKSWSRAEIDALKNGQEQYGAGNCMTFAGGFGCRHTWTLYV